ncbi:trypsin-like peptidase domain-containing protein [Phytohabitans kaempferiae]|uniref:Trypsin-like peptidase domain-containing protein n=1 Tax=Phytohabitans kaempferiae TaxID=1620943 RepID=A0ABV6LXP7_9ACTN
MTGIAALSFAPTRGLDPGRIAEVIVTLRGRPQRRGSGYRVTGTTVLTAAHLVADAETIQVRFDADRPTQWTASATVACGLDEADVAVLAIDPPAEHALVDTVEYAGLGDRDAVLDVRLAGFPRWKQRRRSDGRIHRELHSAHGTVSVLSNRRGGTLEITVPAPAEDPDQDVSPWEAMSGAAVWADNRIVGVVAEHHRREGLGRLSATRIDRCLALAPAPQLFARLLGLADPARLPDAVPPPAGWLTRSGYVEQVRDIAPAGGLVERGAELAELAAFCLGDEPYVWWQAGPWAGKSALMSTFVLNPPPGVDVLSFFVTARLAAQGDSAAFTDALLEQLALLSGETLPPVLTPSARDGQRRALLRTASARAAAAGRRLVLVVDGLDEDRGTAPGSGLPSIASLLPKSVDGGLRVIVSGRPNPPIPNDVPADHPLRRCRIRKLDPSPYALEVADRARLELTELLAGPPAHRDVLGLITACGGGLSLDELEELTGHPRFELDGMLGGLFGRTVAGRADATGGDARRVFLLAHETLRQEAIERLGARLRGEYRARIHGWADHYRQIGWPAHTPLYLLRGYSRMLQDERDRDRLVSYATDGRRHERMLDVTGGDANAFAEIGIAQGMVLAAEPPDLPAAAALAVHRDQLAMRNANIPVRLPAIWARLHLPARAEALVRGMSSPERQTRAMTDLLTAWAGTVDADHAAALLPIAEAAAGGITSPRDRAEAQRDLAEAVALLGEHERAVAIADTIADPRHAAEASARVARTAARHGRFELAEQVARRVTDAYWAARALADVAGALTDAGAVARGAAVARSIGDPYWRAVALTSVLRAGVHTSPVAVAEVRQAIDAVDDVNLVAKALTALLRTVGRAAPPPAVAELLDAAVTAANANPNQYGQGGALAELAQVSASLGHRARADATAAAIPVPHTRSDTVTALAVDAAGLGEYDRAAALADTLDRAEPRALALAGMAQVGADAGATDQASAWADAAARLLPDVVSRPVRLRLLVQLVRVAAAAGQPDRASGWLDDAAAQARESTSGSVRCLALVETVGAAAAAGNHSLVDALAEEVKAAAVAIARSDERCAVLAQAATVMAGLGRFDHGEGIAGAIPEPDRKAEALTGLAELARAKGRQADAMRLATAAEDVARRIANPMEQAAALTGLARALAASDPGRARLIAAAAEPHARAVPEGWGRGRAIVDLVSVLAGLGHYRQAEPLAAQVTDSLLVPAAWRQVARAAAAAGDAERAEAFARRIQTALERDGALALVVAELCGYAARTAHGDTAAILTKGEAIARSISDPTDRVSAYASAMTAWARTRDFGRAADLAAAAERTAASTDEPVARARILAPLNEPLREVVRLAVAARQLPVGEKAAVSITDPEIRARSLIELAVAAIDTGDGRHARAMAGAARSAAEQIHGPNSRDQVMVELARTTAVAGDSTSAVSLAHTINASYYHAEALREIALAIAAEGDHDLALSVVRPIPGHHERARALTALADSAAAGGDHGRAYALGVEAARSVDALKDLSDRTWAVPRVTAELTALARRLVFAGHVDVEHGLLAAIERLALSIRNEHERRQATEDLASVAALSGDHLRSGALLRAAAESKELVKAGEDLLAAAGMNQPPQRALTSGATADFAAAEVQIQKIPDPDERSQALAALAAECADAGETARAVRLAATALAAGKWTNSLLVAYQLEPSVLNAIADAYDV